jgi:hypothetical protein
MEAQIAKFDPTQSPPDPETIENAAKEIRFVEHLAGRKKRNHQSYRSV